MKSDKYINWLDFGIFEANAMFICGFTYDEVAKHLKKKKFGDWPLAFQEIKEIYNEKNWGFVSKRTLATDEIFLFLVLKERFDFSDSSQRKLAHEILHLASYGIMGIIDPLKENESFCYLHTHLMKQVHEILRGKK